MKVRSISITGLALILTALILGSLGPSLWPSAFWSGQYSATIGPGMMAGATTGPGMMNGGMMGSGMMNGGMAGGMMNSGLVDSSAPFDQRFLDQMIMHHQGAVISAQMMIADSARPELRDLAQRIITAQQGEIDQMRQWRQDWYGTANSDIPPGMMSGMMSGAMMSRDQMRQMMGQNLDVDRMFLQMMIPHHTGAITMAQQALAQAEHLQIKTLARSIVTAQQTEITEMQGYLRDWYRVQGQ